MAHRFASVLLLLALAACGGPQIVLDAPPTLPELRTVETAITARIAKAPATTVGQPGFVGLAVTTESHGHLMIADVAADSPAAKAGLKAGDLLLSIGQEIVKDEEDYADRVHAATPGDSLTFMVVRAGDPKEVVVKVGAISRPMKLAEKRAILGLQLGEATEGTGAPVTRVTRDSPADKAGLKTGDVILKIDGTAIASGLQLSDALAERSAGDVVDVLFERGGKSTTVKATLAGDPQADARAAGFNRGGSLWKKEAYRLAIIGIEYPDLKHNAKIALKDWEEQFFSKGTYTKKSATGQNVCGSLNDYYLEQSCGAFHLEGKVLDWVELSKKRTEYAPGTLGREQNAFISEAVEKVEARDKEALKDVDGLFLIYAGGQVPNTSRCGIY